MALPVERASALAEGISEGAVVLSSAMLVKQRFDASTYEGIDFPLAILTDTPWLPAGVTAQVSVVQVILGLRDKTDVVRLY